MLKEIATRAAVALFFLIIAWLAMTLLLWLPPTRHFDSAPAKAAMTLVGISLIIFVGIGVYCSFMAAFSKEKI
ncbi:MAG: hypothetical protein WBA36_03645 [Mesorhizobium sp.]